VEARQGSRAPVLPGPTKTLARCLSALASARLFASDIAAAQALHEQAVKIQRDLGHSRLG
jgi:hypothetical protein